MHFKAPLTAVRSNTRRLFLWLLLLSPGISAQQTMAPAGPEDYVVVHGRMVECDNPHILVAQQVDSELEIFSLDPIPVLNRTAIEIKGMISDQIAKRRVDGKRPKSLTVEILRTEQEYLLIRDEVLRSQMLLNRGDCPPGSPPWKPIKPYEDIIDWHRVATVPIMRLKSFAPLTRTSVSRLV